MVHGGSLLYDEEISTRASATREQMDWQHMEGESWDEYRQPRREISEATYYVTASSHFSTTSPEPRRPGHVCSLADAESSQTTAETSQNTELVIDHEQVRPSIMAAALEVRVACVCRVMNGTTNR